MDEREKKERKRSVCHIYCCANIVQRQSPQFCPYASVLCCNSLTNTYMSLRPGQDCVHIPSLNVPCRSGNEQVVFAESLSWPCRAKFSHTRRPECNAELRLLEHVSWESFCRRIRWENAGLCGYITGGKHSYLPYQLLLGKRKKCPPPPYRLEASPPIGDYLGTQYPPTPSSVSWWKREWLKTKTFRI